MATRNEDAFASLLSTTFSVELPASGVTVECRRVPFTTLMHILTTLAANVQLELQTSLGDIAQLVIDGQKTDATKEGVGMKAMSTLIPALLAAVASMPSLLQRFLTDVIADATPEVVRCISADDALVVISTAFDKMDKVLIAKQLESLFFGLTETARNLGILTKQQVSEDKKKKMQQQEQSEVS